MVSPADVGLFEVGPHADGLLVQLVRFLQSRVVGSDQVGEVDVNIQVVRGDASRVLLSWNYLESRQTTANHDVD